MNDKLGLPGRAHEHGESIAIASSATRAGHFSNRIAVLALFVSIAGVVFSNMSVRDELRQSRESLLLRDRIETCVQVEQRARALADAATSVSYGLEIRNLSPVQRLDEFDRLSQPFAELRAAARLDYLGPRRLQEAEAAVENAGIALWAHFTRLIAPDRQPEPPRVTELVDDLRRKASALHAACVTAVGAYRADPE